MEQEKDTILQQIAKNNRSALVYIEMFFRYYIGPCTGAFTNYLTESRSGYIHEFAQVILAHS